MLAKAGVSTSSALPCEGPGSMSVTWASGQERASSGVRGDHHGKFTRSVLSMMYLPSVARLFLRVVAILGGETSAWPSSRPA